MFSHSLTNQHVEKPAMPSGIASSSIAGLNLGKRQDWYEVGFGGGNCKRHRD